MIEQSKKLDGGKTIKRAQEYDHLNTTYLPRDRTINTVAYYNRRKKQLKQHPSKQVVVNLTQRNAERKDLKNQFQNLIRSNKNIDPYLSNYIREVRVQPVMNDNKFTNFNHQLYPLSQDDKVKIVEQKYFPLQNYYNYIYDMEAKKEIFRFATETEAKINQAIHLQPVQYSPHKDFNYDKNDFSAYEEQRLDKKIRGLHISKFDPKASAFKRQNSTPVQQLVPVHKNYFQQSSMNEKQRLQMSRRY